MQRELVAVPETMNVGDLIDYLRDHDELTTEFWGCSWSITATTRSAPATSPGSCAARGTSPSPT